VRWILICVVDMHFFQQASDIDAIVLYSPLVFRNAGMSSNKAILGDTVGRQHRQDVLRPGGHPLLGPPQPAGVAASMVLLATMLCVHMASAMSMAASIFVSFGLHGGALHRVQAPGGHVQRRDHVVAPAHTGRKPRHGGELADVSVIEHDVHLARRCDLHGWMLLSVRRRGVGVCVRT
jgi:hypothetical protein